MDHCGQDATGDFLECMEVLSRRNAIDSTGDSSVVSACSTVLPRIVPMNFFNTVSFVVYILNLGVLAVTCFGFPSPPLYAIISRPLTPSPVVLIRHDQSPLTS